MKAVIIAKGQLKNKTKQGLPVQETQSATGPSQKRTASNQNSCIFHLTEFPVSHWISGQVHTKGITNFRWTPRNFFSVTSQKIRLFIHPFLRTFIQAVRSFYFSSLISYSPRALLWRTCTRYQQNRLFLLVVAHNHSPPHSMTLYNLVSESKSQAERNAQVSQKVMLASALQVASAWGSMEYFSWIHRSLWA